MIDSVKKISLNEMNLPTAIHIGIKNLKDSRIRPSKNNISKKLQIKSPHLTRPSISL